MPGFGALVQALSNECFAVVLDAELILKQGISLPDVVAFLDTENGQQHLRNDEAVSFVSFGVNDILWNPFGRIVIPLKWSAAGQEEQGESEGVFMHCPYLLPEWQKAMAPSTSTAIAEFSCKHHQKVGSTPVWADRVALFDKMFPSG